MELSQRMVKLSRHRPVKSDNLTRAYTAIIRKRCKTGYKLVFFTNRKLHTGYSISIGTKLGELV